MSPVSPSVSKTTIILQCIANSAPVGIGIQKSEQTLSAPDQKGSSDVDRFSRITSKLIRDIPSFCLYNLTLETIFISKSFSVDPTDQYAPRKSGIGARHGEASGPLFRRRIKPPGQFRRLIVLFDDFEKPHDALPKKSSKQSHLKAIQRLLDLEDNSQMTYYHLVGLGNQIRI